MLERWNKSYQELMLKTRLVSQFGAFWLIIAALVELCRLWKAMYDNWPRGSDLWNSSLKISAFGSLVIGLFAVRFFVLYRRSEYRSQTICLSWLLPVVALFLYWANSNNFWIDEGSNSVIYVFGRTDEILRSGLFFVIVSALRFLSTSLFALHKSR